MSGYNIDEIVAYVDEQGELIPLDSLATKFRSYDDLIAYLQAGSFVGYVRETYGLARVRALWEEGFEQLETILAKTPSAIDAEWRAHLKSAYPVAKVEWNLWRRRVVNDLDPALGGWGKYWGS